MESKIQHRARTSSTWEETLGISKRVSPIDFGWQGEIRLRYTDFQVHEIGPDGKVVHLVETGVSRDKRNQPEQAAVNVQAGEIPVDTRDSGDRKAAKRKASAPVLADVPQPDTTEQSRDIPPEATVGLNELLGESVTQELVKLYKASFEKTKEKLVVKTAVIADKPKRSTIHGLVRTIFRSRIDTATDPSGAIDATIKHAGARGGNRQQQQNQRQGGGRHGKPHQQEQRGEYLHFTLFKENRDTMEAVQHLSRALRIKPNAIGTAGTKDRRAATAQRCSLRHGRAENVARTNGRVFGVMTGDFSYSERAIHLGWHAGNEFVIAAKNCRLLGRDEASMSVDERLAAMQDRVGAALQDTAANGWINYFGHQRFGTHMTGTHEIGMLILKGDFSGAVDAILHHDPAISLEDDGEPPRDPVQRDMLNRSKACLLFATGKAKEGLEILPRRFSAEASVMQHLEREGSRRDFVGAIGRITRGLRTMYLHAYQSLVWNHAASKRWELYGPKVVEGDLVIETNQGSKEDGNGRSDLVADDTIGEGAAAAAAAVVDDADADADADDNFTPLRARPLTADEASSGSYTIRDVVLPSPGTDVIYPTNEMGAFYEEFMALPENGGLDPHSMQRPQREYSLGGRYRKLMGGFLGKPSWEVRAYARDEEQMRRTDMDRIREGRAQGQANSDVPRRGKRGRESEGAEGEGKKAKLDERASQTAEGECKNKEAIFEDATNIETDTHTSTQTPGQTLEQADGAAAMEVDEGDQSIKDKIAVVVAFQLGKSAYATVALRELMGQLPA